MKMHHKIILPAIALAAAASVWGTASIYAQDSALTNPHDTLIQKLVTKFNLKESDVKAVFDEAHEERRVAMEKKMEERLSRAVLEGKINATQKQLILEKHKQMHDEREAERNTSLSMTPEQRRAQHDEKRQELKTWAEQNGIDLQYLFGMGRRGMK